MCWIVSNSKSEADRENFVFVPRGVCVCVCEKITLNVLLFVTICV